MMAKIIKNKTEKLKKLIFIETCYSNTNAEAKI